LVRANFPVISSTSHAAETAALPAFGILDDGASDIRPKVIGLYTVLIAANLLAWTWAFAVFSSHPLLLATASIAYGFGLRHAVDAQHIAAIDTVTSKLMQEGKRPITVGFFFSLGYSSIVIAASLLIAVTESSLQQRFPGLIEVKGMIGTSVSVLFLFAIAIINIGVLTSVYRLFRRVKAGEAYAMTSSTPFLPNAACSADFRASCFG
jgi:high-affinity nickel-transport protein